MRASSSGTGQLGQLCSPHIVELEAPLTWIFLLLHCGQWEKLQ